MNSVEVFVHEAADAAALAGEVASTWSDAFEPIVDFSDWQDNLFNRHRRREGYRLAVARTAGHLVGFGWGYVGHRGEYWPDLVRKRLGPTAEQWVGGHVELAELAVHPSVRRQGIGRQLHDVLMAALPSRPALLGAASDPADPAVQLYRSLGWRRLGLLASGKQVMLRLPQ